MHSSSNLSEPAILFSSPFENVSIPTSSNLADYIFSTIEGHKDNVAIVDGIQGRSYRYGEVEQLVANAASGLSLLCIRHGDAVMLLLPNCPEYPILVLAIASLGAVSVPANPTSREADISKQLKDSSTKLIITVSVNSDNVASFGLPVIYLDNGPPGSIPAAALFSADGSKAPRANVSVDDLCILPYSSGTTGASKGVMLTHGNLIANVAQHVEGRCPRKYYSPDDVVLGLLPMFHIYAISAINLCVLKSGATLVTMPRFDLEHMLQLADKYRITVAPIVPPIILALAKSKLVEKYRWRSLRSVTSGAAPLGAEVEEAFKARFPNVILAQGYGLTESSPTVLLSLAFQKGGGPTVPGSAGVLMPNTEAMIVDTASGTPLTTNQAGELWVRGPQVMKGYLNNSEATSETIDSEGWLHTGDVAYVDDSGNFFIVDRVKELIKVKGFQVPPAELESILISHPFIADAAVVPQLDDESGELPVAFIVRSSQLPGEEAIIGEADVKAFVAKQVAKYKWLHRVIFVDFIPKSASGKILRRELRSRL